MQQRTVFRCALKVVLVAELFATGDREFQTTGGVILNTLELPADRVVVDWRISECELVMTNKFT